MSWIEIRLVHRSIFPGWWCNATHPHLCISISLIKLISWMIAPLCSANQVEDAVNITESFSELKFIVCTIFGENITVQSSSNRSRGRCIHPIQSINVSKMGRNCLMQPESRSDLMASNVFFFLNFLIDCPKSRGNDAKLTDCPKPNEIPRQKRS